MSIHFDSGSNRYLGRQTSRKQSKEQADEVINNKLGTGNTTEKKMTLEEFKKAHPEIPSFAIHDAYNGYFNSNNNTQAQTSQAVQSKSTNHTQETKNSESTVSSNNTDNLNLSAQILKNETFEIKTINKNNVVVFGNQTKEEQRSTEKKDVTTNNTGNSYTTGTQNAYENNVYAPGLYTPKSFGKTDTVTIEIDGKNYTFGAGNTGKVKIPDEIIVSGKNPGDVNAMVKKTVINGEECTTILKFDNGMSVANITVNNKGEIVKGRFIDSDGNTIQIDKKDNPQDTVNTPSQLQSATQTESDNKTDKDSISLKDQVDALVEPELRDDVLNNILTEETLKDKKSQYTEKDNTKPDYMNFGSTPFDSPLLRNGEEDIIVPLRPNNNSSVTVESSEKMSFLEFAKNNPSIPKFAMNDAYNGYLNANNNKPAVTNNKNTDADSVKDSYTGNFTRRDNRSLVWTDNTTDGTITTQDFLNGRKHTVEKDSNGNVLKVIDEYSDGRVDVYKPNENGELERDLTDMLAAGYNNLIDESMSDTASLKYNWLSDITADIQKFDDLATDEELQSWINNIISDNSRDMASLNAFSPVSSPDAEPAVMNFASNNATSILNADPKVAEIVAGFYPGKGSVIDIDNKVFNEGARNVTFTVKNSDKSITTVEVTLLADGSLYNYNEETTIVDNVSGKSTIISVDYSDKNKTIENKTIYECDVNNPDKTRVVYEEDPNEGTKIRYLYKDNNWDTPTTKTVLQNNNDGTKTSTTYINDEETYSQTTDNQGKIISETYYTYGEGNDSDTIEEINYNSNDEVIDKTTTIINYSSNDINYKSYSVEKEFKSDGNLVKQQFEEDSNGNELLTQEIIKDNKGNELYRNEYSYDKNGKLISRTLIETKNGETIVTTYDTKGNETVKRYNSPKEADIPTEDATNFGDNNGDVEHEIVDVPQIIITDDDVESEEDTFIELPNDNIFIKPDLNINPIKVNSNTNADNSEWQKLHFDSQEDYNDAVKRGLDFSAAAYYAIKNHGDFVDGENQNGYSNIKDENGNITGYQHTYQNSDGQKITDTYNTDNQLTEKIQTDDKGNQHIIEYKYVNGDVEVSGTTDWYKDGRIYYYDENKNVIKDGMKWYGSDGKLHEGSRDEYARMVSQGKYQSYNAFMGNMSEFTTWTDNSGKIRHGSKAQERRYKNNNYMTKNDDGSTYIKFEKDGKITSMRVYPDGIVEEYIQNYDGKFLSHTQTDAEGTVFNYNDKGEVESADIRDINGKNLVHLVPADFYNGNQIDNNKVADFCINNGLAWSFTGDEAQSVAASFLDSVKNGNYSEWYKNAQEGKYDTAYGKKSEKSNNKTVASNNNVKQGAGTQAYSLASAPSNGGYCPDGSYSPIADSSGFYGSIMGGVIGVGGHGGEPMLGGSMCGWNPGAFSGGSGSGCMYQN